MRGDVFRRELFSLLTDCVKQANGLVIKHLGDGLMVVFERSTVGALGCAAAMHDCVEGLDHEDPVQLRVGISVGEVVEEDGDWFGTPVVEAARLCNAAKPGQTLAPTVLAKLVGTRAPTFQFLPIGPVELKGFTGPLDVVEVCAIGGPTPGDDRVSISDPSGEHSAPAQAVPPSPVDSRLRSRDGRRRQHRSRPQGRRVMLGACAGLIAAFSVGFLTFHLRDREATSQQEPHAARSSPTIRSEPVGYKPALTPTDCEPELQLTAPEAECSLLIVPESRSIPDGRQLKIPVATLSGPDRTTADPVVILDVNDPIARTTLDDVASVVTLSPRGFGGEAGAALQCPEMRDAWRTALARPSDDRRAIDSKVAAARDCAQGLRSAGFALESFNLQQVALDLRDLIIALNTPRVSIASGGYLTPAATSFIRSNPAAVSSVVLTNPTPPGESTFAAPAESLSTAFGRLNELCAQQQDCRTTFNNLEDTYRTRIEALSAEPVDVTTQGLNGEGTFNVVLDGRRLAAALKSSMQSSGQLGLVPSGVLDATNELVAAVGISEDLNTYISARAFGPAFLSMVCSYDQLSSRLSEIGSETLREFAGANDPSLVRVCQAWNVPAVFDELSIPLRSQVPALLIEGAFSVAGLHNWAQTMATQLPNAHVARFSTMSEDLAFSPPGCLSELKMSFLKAPDEALDTRECETSSPSINFVGGR